MVHDMCFVRPALLYLNVQVLKVFYEQINYYYYYYYYYYNYSRRSRTALYKLNQHRHRLDSDRSYHFFRNVDVRAISDQEFIATDSGPSTSSSAPLATHLAC